jgi:hypothetical protein
MKVFLRVAAVLVAWGNLYVPATFGNPTGLIEFGRSHGWSEALQSQFFGAVVWVVAGLLTAEVVIQADALAPGGPLPDPLRCDCNGGVLRRDAVWRNTNVSVWFAL